MGFSSTERGDTSTADPIVPATYQTVRGVSGGMHRIDPTVIYRGRTVSTSATVGTIGLRYAPRNSRFWVLGTSS